MTEELEITAISPDTVFISGQAMTEKDALGAIDVVLDELNNTGNMANVDTAIDTLLGIQRFSGKSIAKLLHGSKAWWNNDNTTVNKSFEDHMESRHGLKKVTIDRYITVWECIQTKQIPASVAVRPMRELVPIAKTLSHGHTIEKKVWNTIAKATGLNEISNILRKVKGKAPRKSSMQIYLKRDGSLEVWKDKAHAFIGWVDKEAYKNDPLAKQAIDRLLDTAGVIRK